MPGNLSEEERRRLLVEVREKHKKDSAKRPVQHITNPKFVEPVSPGLDENGKPKFAKPDQK